MDDILTARQAQEILKVDRITIYRMINDGRLKGNKIGQQWRFSRSDVEDLLNGLKLSDDSAQIADDRGLPVHCLQAIQDLFSAVSEFPAVLVNLQGEPITNSSEVCQFCQFVSTDPVASEKCQASRRGFAEEAAHGSRHFVCHAGLHYAGVPVKQSEKIIGLLLGRGYRRQGNNDENNRFNRVTLSHIPQEQLQAAYQTAPEFPAEQENKLDSWAAATAQAFESILQERSAFARRLKKIADLTQIP